MSSEPIALIILFGSFLGLFGIIIRKIPVLAALPELDFKNGEEGLVSKIKREVKRNGHLKNFSSGLFLEKFLTDVRSLSKKTDKKTFQWIQKIRKNTQKKKIKEDNDYWDEVKNITED